MSENQVFNILHVIVRLPVGGVENMLYKVLTNYDRGRFNSMVCCIQEGGEIAEKLKKEGFRVEVLGRMQGHGFDTGAITGIYRLLKKEDIHILRTHQYHSNLYGRIAGALAGVPVAIPSVHNLYSAPHKPKPHRGIINGLLARFSDKIVAVSGAVAADMIKFDRVRPDKIRVVYNGVDLEALAEKIDKEEARKRLGLPLESSLIGTVGRLKTQKGHRFLLEACAGLQNTALAVAGDGPLLPQLREIAAQNKINCIFMGTVSPEKIPVFLKALDIYCFPSLWEGLPSALVEAMAAGLPVIASDLPPHREVLQGAGLFFPARDRLRLRAGLQELIGNQSLRESLARKALRRAQDFSIKNTVDSYEKIFEEELERVKLTTPA